MNSLLEEHYNILKMYQSLRDQLMKILTNEDLNFSPGGVNPTLGQLCKELGEVEHAYVQSFKTFKVDLSYRHDDSVATSVTQLIDWYAELDQGLEAALAALTDEDVQNRVIHRADNFKLPAHIHLEVYREALSIFHGKVSVYLKAMNKPMPKQWQEWIT